MDSFYILVSVLSGVSFIKNSLRLKTAEIIVLTHNTSSLSLRFNKLHFVLNFVIHASV